LGKRYFKLLIYNNDGFTLIELLIVIAVLAILTAVAIPNVKEFIRSSRLAAANTELLSVNLAIQSFEAENQSTPGDSSSTAFLYYVQNHLVGSYSWDASGNVTVASYAAGINYNSTAKQFQ